MPNPEYDCVVVGGGIAGLVGAHELRDSRVLLLERDGRLGGRVKSERRGEYWVNLGAQFLSGGGPVIELSRLPGIEALPLASKSALLDVRGRRVASGSPAALCFKLPLSLRERLDLARFGIGLEMTYKRMPQRSFRAMLDGKSAADVFRGARRGEPRRMLDALSRAWMGAELEEVSGAHAVLYVRTSLAKAREVPALAYPIGGNQSIVEAIVDVIANDVEIELDSEVRSVTPDSNGVAIEYERAGDTVSVAARQCIVATPAHAARELVTELSDDHRAALDAVKYGVFVVAGVFTKETGPQFWDDAYMMTVTGRSFQAIFNPACVLRREGHRRPGGAVSVYAGGAPARELLSATDAEVREVFGRDLHEVLGLDELAIGEMVVQKWPKAIPYWAPGGYAHIRTLREPYKAIHFAGDHLGYPSMSTAGASGQAAARGARRQIALAA